MLGFVIKEMRREAGITQVELADEIGSTQPTISVWERTGRMPVDLVPRIAQALSVKITDIYARLAVMQEDAYFWEILYSLKGPDQ